MVPPFMDITFNNPSAWLRLDHLFLQFEQRLHALANEVGNVVKAPSRSFSTLFEYEHFTPNLFLVSFGAQGDEFGIYNLEDREHAGRVLLQPCLFFLHRSQVTSLRTPFGARLASIALDFVGSDAGAEVKHRMALWEAGPRTETVQKQCRNSGLYVRSYRERSNPPRH
jgi:hypothetical protein